MDILVCAFTLMSLVVINNLYFFVYMYTYHASHIYFFYVQVKNKPNGGIAYPALILGACIVTNTHHQDYCVGRDKDTLLYTWVR
jgi:hypothetical protein